MARDILSPGLTHNSLTVDTTVIGNISASSDIRIDGILEGNLAVLGNAHKKTGMRAVVLIDEIGRASCRERV